MPVFLTDVQEYAEASATVRNICNTDVKLPLRIFSNEFDYFRYVNFDDMFDCTIYDHLINFVSQIGDNNLFLHLVEPHADTYFRYHFNKYGVLKIDTRDSCDEYYDIVASNPGGSPADALLYNSFKLAFYSPSASWMLYGDRDYGIGIVGFSHPSLASLFDEQLPTSVIDDPEEAFTRIMKPNIREERIHLFYDVFINNYATYL